jgi:hypothetical protein
MKRRAFFTWIVFATAWYYGKGYKDIARMD